MVVQWVPPTEEERRDASRTLPSTEAGKKSPAAPSPDAGAHAFRTCGGAVSPCDLTDRTPYDEVDAPQGETTEKGSLTYKRCA